MHTVINDTVNNNYCNFMVGVVNVNVGVVASG